MLLVPKDRLENLVNQASQEKMALKDLGGPKEIREREASECPVFQDGWGLKV